MKKYLFILLLHIFYVFADNKAIKEIDKNIENQQQKQKDIDRQRANLNLKLGTLGQNIRNNVEEIKRLDSEIQNLAKNIEDNKDQNKNQAAKLQSLEEQLASLNEQMEKSQIQLSNLILRYMTFSRVLDDEEVMTMDDVVSREAFNALKQQTIANIAVFQQRQNTIAKQINDVNKSITQVTQIINTQETRQQNLQNMIGKQKVLVDNMKGEMQAYSQRLKNLDIQKKQLDNLLVNLNILKKKTQEDIKRQKEQERLAKLEKERLAKLEKERQKKAEEERKKAEIAKAQAQKRAKEKADEIAKTNAEAAKKFLGEQNQAIQREYETKISSQEANSAINSLEDLKRVDSVYQKPEIVKYTGKKMGSPLDSYTLEQAFGDYIDPTYKIKIFNNGVVLKSKSQDAQVYNIMDGKVIFAQEAPGLKKVVIIQHANSMHSIYSMLDKIAPTLKSGFIIKKGYVIGKVNDRLNLEIIQSGKHINPLEVIANK